MNEKWFHHEYITANDATRSVYRWNWKENDDKFILMVLLLFYFSAYTFYNWAVAVFFFLNVIQLNLFLPFFFCAHDFFSLFTVKPTSINITSKPKHFASEIEYSINCEVDGSIPETDIRWTQNNRPFKRGKVSSNYQRLRMQKNLNK